MDGLPPAGRATCASAWRPATSARRGRCTPTSASSSRPTASARMWDPALGAGALLDMGIYPLTFARLMLGPFADGVAAGRPRRERHRPRRGDRRAPRERRASRP